MPFEGEPASKLGHLTLINSPWVRDLVDGFERVPAPAGDPGRTQWVSFAPDPSRKLSRVWAVDGSFVEIGSHDSPPREVAFVKTALVQLDFDDLAAIDPHFPHPHDLRDAMARAGTFHATAFPLRRIQTRLGNNYTAVRHIVRDSIRQDEDGAWPYHDTLKWLAYRLWAETPTASPEFQCPHCEEDVPGLPAGADAGQCPHCLGEVFLTDLPGFHQGMGEDAAPVTVASDYMLVMETLMLFTAVRLSWQSSNRKLVSDTLFLKDGPLTLRGQYSKLVEPIRDFLQHARQIGRPVHVAGLEKSGAFVDHLAGITRFAPPQERGESPAAAVLTHDYVRREVQRMSGRSNPYGMKTNYGEKVYVKLDPATPMVLSVPTGRYDERGDWSASTASWRRSPAWSAAGSRAPCTRSSWRTASRRSPATRRPRSSAASSTRLRATAGEPLPVTTALQLINRFLAEDDFDADTQFCLHWFESHGWDAGPFGTADTLARAKGTSVEGVRQAGVIESGGGLVRLLKWKEYPAHWDPATDDRLPVWEALHQLIRAYNTHGETGAARVLAGTSAQADAARQLAYRLYTLCERAGRAEDARAYNEVVTGWAAIESAAVPLPAPPRQGTLFDGVAE